jgi:hypothetical protein
MRKSSLTSLFVLIFTCLALAGQNSAGNNFAGSWAGSWTGGSNGKIDMTIAGDASGKLSITLIATPEQGDATTFQSKTAEVVDNKLKAKFEAPDGALEVSLEGAIDGASLKGTYSVRDKAQGNEVESGTWTVSKK